MKRRLVKNRHQYKLNVPIELVRKLGLNKGNSVIVEEVKTPEGNGFIVLKDNNIIRKMALNTKGGRNNE